MLGSPNPPYIIPDAFPLDNRLATEAYPDAMYVEYRDGGKVGWTELLFVHVPVHIVCPRICVHMDVSTADSWLIAEE